MTITGRSPGEQGAGRSPGEQGATPLSTAEKTEREAINAALDEINRLRALVDRYEAALHDIAKWPGGQGAAQDMAGRAYRALHPKDEEA